MVNLQRSKLTARMNRAAQLAKTNKPKAVGFSACFMFKKRTIGKQSAAVYMALNYGKKRLVFSTKIVATKDTLDRNTGRITGNPNDTKLLGDLLHKANVSHAELALTGRMIDLNVIRAFVLGIEVQNTPTALECLRVFFEKVVTVEYEVGDIEKSSFDKLRNWTAKVRDYITTQHGTGTLLSDIVPAHARNYCLWLQSEKGISNDPSMAMTEYFKRVLNYAVENEWIERNPFMSFRKKLLNKRGEWLTALEIRQIATTPIQSNVLEKVRDIFLMQCYTGLAYAEIKALSTSHIETGKNGTKYIAIQRQKTVKSNPTPCTIRLSKLALLLIDKYQTANGKTIFEVQANQKVNNYLKEIAVITGIKKRLTTHVARRTFAEYCLNDLEIDIEIVALMLGHGDSKTTKKHYGRIRPETVLNKTLQLTNQPNLVRQ